MNNTKDLLKLKGNKRKSHKNHKDIRGWNESNIEKYLN